MATKAKLSLSQLLFRRSNSSANNSSNSSSQVGKYEQFADFQEQLQHVNKVYPPKTVQANFATVSAASGRHGLFEIQKVDNTNIINKGNDTHNNSQQLQGILKKTGNVNDNVFRSAAAGGKTTRSSLHRSRSNPNPNNNPLKEVSWNCPTLEKRRDVILNYFESIILENKQEQQGTQNKPNIPWNNNGSSPPSGEPIYEEISECPVYNTTTSHPNSSERTGSLKPKVMPKKVRMNIPQEQQKNSSPIYDKVLSRSHSMIEPSSPYYSGGNSGFYDVAPSTISSSESQGFYENFAPYSSSAFSSSSSSSSGSDYIINGNKNIPRSHSFHDNYRATSHSASYNLQGPDPDQMYAKVCKRKKPKAKHEPQLAFVNCAENEQPLVINGVTMIPVIMPSSFSTSCLSLSSSDNNTDDTTILRNNDHDNERNGISHYSCEKILPDKDITYLNPHSETKRNRNNLSVIHLLASYNPATELESFIPTTGKPGSSSSFTAIIDSTGSAPKSISVPVRAGDFNNSNVNSCNYRASEEGARYPYSPPTRMEEEPLMATNCSYAYDADDYEGDKHEKLSCSSSSCSDGEADDDDGETKYQFPDGVVGGVALLKKITFQDDPLLSDSEDDDICEHKSLLEMTSTKNAVQNSRERSGDKYLIEMDDDEREFDSFLEDNGSSSPEEKPGSPFNKENLRNQLTFSQSQQDVPQEALKKKAASVLDLINSEISDLHMRELELKKVHGSSPTPPKSDKEDKLRQTEMEEFSGEEGSSGEDDFSDSAIEYDGFTTNGSHSSGQVSPSDNLNEISSHHQPDEQIIPLEVESNVVEMHSSVKNDEVDHKMNPQRQTVRPLEEEEDRTIKFDVTDETPIEREIRLTREREEEFRQLKGLKPMGAINSGGKSKVEKTASLPPAIKQKSVSQRPAKFDLQSLQPQAGAGGPKDAQLEMATARFKKEIEESMKREQEILRESRQRRVSGSVEDSPVEPASPVEEKKEEEKPTRDTERSPSPQEEKQQVPLGPENQLRKPTIVKLPINKLPAARFFAPSAFNGSKQNRITPVVSPIRGGSMAFPSGRTSPSVGGSLPIGKPSFTSLEKYIMQTSYNYMSNKPSTAPVITEEVPKVAHETMAKRQAPVPLPVAEDPLRIVPKQVKDEEEEEEDKEEDEKPKRRYVPAQDKIHKEIQELVMREKELTTARAKWKSTLDLPESMKDENEAETTKSTLSLHMSNSISTRELSPTAVAVNDDERERSNSESSSAADNETDFRQLAEDVKQVTRARAPARRRHSLLITQWEERIRQQQQLNNRK